MKKLRYSSLLGLLVISAVSMTVYQNCGQFGGGFDFLNYGNTSMSSSTLADTDHPAGSKATQSVQKMQIANRGYVAHLVREVFTSATYPVPALENIILQWVEKRDAQFGLGCDPYSTHSGRDCGGDISAANLPYTTDDNTVRQSYRIQLCDNILGYDNSVNAALEKIQVNSLAPNADGIRQIYELFYRGDGAPQEVVDALVIMDRSLAENGESTIHRWRAVMLQICTSPGWQLL
ncbi:hypothetical protein [Bdellovibrio sp. HCB337]|uniref:hypothetical protein n=1 Tax=Bdellovibrio sp. HCB337 TaxID=3394358 RepID=UPI0039A63980